MEPYPHDVRCGCRICPDCTFQRPCDFCFGNCVVCKGFIHPGPQEIVGSLWIPQGKDEIKRYQDFCATLSVSCAGGLDQIPTQVEVNHGRAVLQNIHLHARTGDIEGMVHEVLDEFVDVNTPDAVRGFAPLHHSAMMGQCDITRFLILQGASVNASVKGLATSAEPLTRTPEMAQITPLALAFSNRHMSVAKVLLQNNAVVDSESVGDLLVAAVENAQPEILILLLDRL